MISSTDILYPLWVLTEQNRTQVGCNASRPHLCLVETAILVHCTAVPPEDMFKTGHANSLYQGFPLVSRARHFTLILVLVGSWNGLERDFTIELNVSSVYLK